jgi:hypothetical protein
VLRSAEKNVRVKAKDLDLPSDDVEGSIDAEASDKKDDGEGSLRFTLIEVHAVDSCDVSREADAADQDRHRPMYH